METISRFGPADFTKGRVQNESVDETVQHSMLMIAYCLLTQKEVYPDLGRNTFDLRESSVVRKRLVSRLKHLGYQVILAPLA